MCPFEFTESQFTICARWGRHQEFLHVGCSTYHVAFLSPLGRFVIKGRLLGGGYFHWRDLTYKFHRDLKPVTIEPSPIVSYFSFIFTSFVFLFLTEIIKLKLYRNYFVPWIHQPHTKLRQRNKNILILYSIVFKSSFYYSFVLEWIFNFTLLQSQRKLAIEK